MTIPDDLTIEIRGGHVRLSANGRTGDIEYTRRGGGVFFDGPRHWRDMMELYVWPALWQLTQ